MPTRLVLVAFATILVAACSGGPGPTARRTTQSSPAPTILPTDDATEPPRATVDPLLALSFCEPFAAQVLSIWPPSDAATAGDLDVSFRAWKQNPHLAALADDLAAVLVYLAVAVKSSSPVSPTTTAAEAFDRIEGFAAENC